MKRSKQFNVLKARLQQGETRHQQVRIAIVFAMLAAMVCILVAISMSAFAYWVSACVMTGMDAVLCLAWVGYLQYCGKTSMTASIGQVGLHWVGAILTIAMIAFFLYHHVLTIKQAGVVTLLVLGLTLYLVGIYSEILFILIGVLLGIFAMTAAFSLLYVWCVMIPLIILTAVLTVMMVTRETSSVLMSK